MQDHESGLAPQGGTLLLRLRTAGLLSVLLLLLVGTASAQVSTASVNGVIRSEEHTSELQSPA